VFAHAFGHSCLKSILLWILDQNQNRVPVALISLINSWNAFHRRVLLLSRERLHWGRPRQMGSGYWNKSESICSGPGYMLCLWSTSTIILFFPSSFLWCRSLASLHAISKTRTLILICRILLLETQTGCHAEIDETRSNLQKYNRPASQTMKLSACKWAHTFGILLHQCFKWALLEQWDNPWFNI